MTYQDILVHVDEHPSSKPRAAAAAALAARLNARLTGVFLKSEFLRDAMVAESLAYMPPDALQALIEEEAAARLQASEAARGIFEAEARRAGANSDWLVVDGRDQELIACARRFDLTVFPPIAKVSLSLNDISAAAVALGSGGPVLVIPEGGAPPALAERVIVAWKGSRESARALRDAWPLLSQAKEVHVLIVSPRGEGGPDGLLQRHLENHGLKANLIVDRSHDASAGQILRDHVAALKADLVVMGVYGRPRLQELVLGGVSHDLLAEPPCALLISH
ncbi:universal stress protein [Phenylobacterium sp.]|uniref:universal stress protein n=1 Tax=Phenylobacterium sp. TaxID=1871053 RepID=UPI0027378143|nr:universal stress protein [Phenylobacterium sp.]MDP3867791.1 universal stress protein [Phenylobacterium sp.]